MTARRQRYWDYPSKTTVADIIGDPPAAVWLLEGPALTVVHANGEAERIAPDLRNVPIDEAFELDDRLRPLADAAYQCYGLARQITRHVDTADGPRWCLADLRVEDGRKFGVSLWLGTTEARVAQLSRS